jgi:hypothetical protein
MATPTTFFDDRIDCNIDGYVDGHIRGHIEGLIDGHFVGFFPMAFRKSLQWRGIVLLPSRRLGRTLQF